MGLAEGQAVAVQYLSRMRQTSHLAKTIAETAKKAYGTIIDRDRTTFFATGYGPMTQPNADDL
jgi:hypothetical protein